jgi:hypothetical protein
LPLVLSDGLESFHYFFQVEPLELTQPEVLPKPQTSLQWIQTNSVDGQMDNWAGKLFGVGSLHRRQPSLHPPLSVEFAEAV